MDEIASAQKARDALNQLKSDGTVAKILADNPPLQRQESSASDSLRSAVKGANDGQKAGDAAAVRAAGDLADQARRQFDALRTDLQKRRDEAGALARRAEEEEQARLSAAAQLEQERETIRQLAGQARAVLGQITSQGPEAAAVRTSLEGAIQQAASAETNQSLTELTAIKTNVANQIATAEIALASVVPQKAGEPPPSLTAAANAFLGGRYDDVITLLETQKYGDAKEIAHAQLFLAAARFALYYDGGQKNAALLRKAENDVKTCKIADPAMAPQTKFFSPRFVAFFKSKG